MAAQASFDITSGVDIQEVDNAVNQARKDIAQRYDFKGSRAAIDLNRTDNTVRRVITLQQGIPAEAAKEIVKFLKERKLKKVQASIQADQVRVSSGSKDDLQEAIRVLREHDFGVALQFGNYRG